MNYINITNGPKSASSVILGCMRMPALSVDDASEIIRTAYDLGINFFDHATCYGKDGEAETHFGDAFKNTGIKREDVYIQSKCGIITQSNEFDWTKENIIKSVDDSLRRLKLDYLDVLLLHRPDLLYEPEEIAQAFDTLEKNGKVRYFGVSNVPPMMFEVLKKYIKQPLIINQLQFSLEQSQLLDQTLYVNNLTTERSIDRDNGLLDYCRLNEITIQAWSPLQSGYFKGCFVDDPRFPELNRVLQEFSDKYGISKTAVAIAWILRHPSKIQAIAGTMNPMHLKDISQATGITLTHNEWYRLYLSSGKFLP